MKLAGKRAVITGGGRGLGLALARRLRGEDVAVVLVGRDRPALEAAAAGLGGGALVVPADVGTPQGRAEITRACAEAPVDLLVNNAAIQLNRTWHRQPSEALLEDIRNELAINLEGPLALTASLLPQLVRRHDAAVVTISSGLALAPKASAPVYCASKAALSTATRALRYQMQDAGLPVRFVDVVLPMVDTDMTQGRGGARKANPDDVADQIVRDLARGRDEIWVGQARLLRRVMRLSPSLGYRILRGSTDRD